MRGDALPDTGADAAANAVSVACADADNAGAHAYAAADAAAAVQARLRSHHRSKYHERSRHSPQPLLFILFLLLDHRRLHHLSLWHVRRGWQHVPRLSRRSVREG